MRILVTGGVRSGKSRHAESLMDGETHVSYVAAGLAASDADPEWSARVAAHQARRPDHWRTVETSAIADAVVDVPGAVLVECLGTWLTRTIDAAEAWVLPADDVRRLVLPEVESLSGALRGCEALAVVVTNEVGHGVVPEHQSGRLFRDVLGEVNRVVAQACDAVHLVVAGRILEI